MPAEISSITVDVRPSQNFQTVGISATLSFKEPVSLDEAKFEADVVYAELEAIATKRVKELGEARGNLEIPAAQGGGIAAATSSDNWRTAYKPNGAGQFRFIPTSVLSKNDFLRMAEEKLPSLGLDPAQVVVFDDRGGDRGIEAGEKYYCAGKVKARRDSQLESIMEGKTIVANIDFDTDGSLKMSLSRDGKTAVQALRIASQLGGTPEPQAEAVPF